ncbi:MAG: hypothetical protein VB039_05285 [Oscillospiraceae bacterium]|nr:hypothetical protein [Oscillospiraceae bacterium]
MGEYKDELARLCVLMEAMSDEQQAVVLAYGEGFAAALALASAG